MNKICFIITFVILLRPVMPIIDYAVNYDYISKVLCVNKAQPAMHCNGKCHLMKELAKASENERPASSDKKNVHQENEVLFYEALKPFFIENHIFDPEKSINDAYSNLYIEPEGISFFHPPIALS